MYRRAQGSIDSADSFKLCVSFEGDRLLQWFFQNTFANGIKIHSVNLQVGREVVYAFRILFRTVFQPEIP